jgi:hypothetical protein
VKSHSIEVVKDSSAEVYRTLDGLLAAVRACRALRRCICRSPRPVVRPARCGANSRRRTGSWREGVHASGVPWDDRSGERLRDWMGIDAETFFTTRRASRSCRWVTATRAAASGDLPPRREVR